MNSLYNITNSVFNWLEHRWERPEGQRLLGTFLVLSYLLTISAIELNRLEFFPSPMRELIPTNHLLAIEIAFNLLLLMEIISLVLSLSRSVAVSVGKQFEVLSLILIRDTLKEFSHFHEPLVWAEVSHSINPILASAVGALLIFVILGFYYQAQKHKPITKDPHDQEAFISAKKMIALTLLVGFIGLSLSGLVAYLRSGLHHVEFTVFEEFYTMLVFSDILIVLISLRYSSNYIIAFRNSGFAVSTVLIRLALIAPVTMTAVLGVFAMLFNLGVLLAYNQFAHLMQETSLTTPHQEGHEPSNMSQS